MYILAGPLSAPLITLTSLPGLSRIINSLLTYLVSYRIHNIECKIGLYSKNKQRYELGLHQGLSLKSFLLFSMCHYAVNCP